MSLLYWLPLINDAYNQGLNGDTTTIMGSGITYTPGKLGNAATFPNNPNSCLNLPGLQLQTGSWCAWIKCMGEGSGTYQFALSEGRDSGFGGINIRLAKSGLSIYAEAHKIAMTSQAISLNTWYHITFTFGNNILKFYINGNLVETKNYTENTDFSNSNNRFVIGKMAYSYTNTGNYFPFNGQINDVRIYNHCLSNKEVKEIAKGLVLHYKLDNIIDNNIYDCSGYQNNGTIVGTLSVNNNTSHYSKSILFNGTDACIRVPYKECNPDGIFTLNLWFYKDALGSKNYETLFGGPSGFEMDTRSGASTTLSLYMASTRGGNAFSPFSLSTWYMVTMVRDGTNEMYYINGELKKTIEAKSMPNGIYRIGAWASDTGQNYYGNISDFRIYATVLSDEDILDLYHTPFSIDNKGNSYAREVIEDTNLNITKTGQFHGNEMLDDDTFTTASITKDDKQLKVNTLYEY